MQIMDAQCQDCEVADTFPRHSDKCLSPRDRHDYPQMTTLDTD